LPVLTQQRLCLVRAHDGCERFLHARELRSAALARERPGPDEGDGEAALAPASTSVASRVLAQPRPVLVGLVVVGLVVVLAGAFALGGGTAAGPSPSSAPSGGVPASGGLEPDPSGGAEASPGDGMRRYRVRQGDTLRSIADRFGITVRQLRAVNSLDEQARIEPGTILLVPQGD
jgi:hypothetical protein